MAYLHQASATVADTAKLSLSMWFRIPSDGGMQINSFSQSLLNFGLNGESDLLKASTIQLTSSGSQWFIRAFLFGGAVVNPLAPPPFFGMNNQFNSNGMTSLGETTIDAWHHLAIGYDGSQGIGGNQGLSASPVFKVILDGSTVAGTASASTPANSAIFDAGRTSNGLYVQGFPIGMPLTTEQLETPLQFTHKIEFGDTQIWFDSYIDWSDPDNFAKLVTVTGDIGSPASMAEAAIEFGDPQFKFTGGADQFGNNLGTGGSLTKIGTLTNFSPNPSCVMVA